ncbi:hypothetical protein [Rathayibacter soli]|nr:hypothetical protein [Glaciibacter superstes]
MDPNEHAQIVKRFVIAATTGDIQALINLIDPDVILISDGGGKARAARVP